MHYQLSGFRLQKRPKHSVALDVVGELDFARFPLQRFGDPSAYDLSVRKLDDPSPSHEKGRSEKLPCDASPCVDWLRFGCFEHLDDEVLDLRWHYRARTSQSYDGPAVVTPRATVVVADELVRYAYQLQFRHGDLIKSNVW